MKRLFLIFFLLKCFTVNAQGILATIFSYDRTGSDYNFYFSTSFGVGSGSGVNCPKLEFFLDNHSNDTLYIKVFYGVHHTSLMGCSRKDTIKYFNHYTGINYINLSSNAILYYADTSWNEHDSTFSLYPSSVRELSTGNAVSIFPNPATDIINLKAASIIECFDWVIYNTLGQVVITKPKTAVQNTEIDVRQLSNGFYLISLFDENKNYLGNTKFYKQ